MCEKPLVSVLTPAFNAEPFIGAAIESILNQSFKNFEYIIVDDNSQDGTWKSIQSYAQKDSRIVAIRNDNNLGIAGNRNKALPLARGQFIAWQDADDISLASRLEHQVTFLQKHPEVAIVGGYLQFFDEKGFKGIRKYPTQDAELRKVIFKYSPVAQPAAMIRHSALKEAGEYDLEFPPAEDLDMTYRLCIKHKMANLGEVVVLYRESPGSATATKLQTIERNTIKIRKKYANTEHYEMTFGDKIYLLFHHLSLYIVPAKLKAVLFKLLSTPLCSSLYISSYQKGGQ
jgi:glycosyltransferase involved in cell wall biosynthesis